MKPLTCEQVNLLGSCVPVKGMMSERNVYEMWLRGELNKMIFILVLKCEEHFFISFQTFLSLIIIIIIIIIAIQHLIQKSALGIIVPSMSYSRALHLPGVPSLQECRDIACINFSWQPFVWAYFK